MEGFALLLGHLVGDFILQNDFLAYWKTNPPPELDHGDVPEKQDFLEYLFMLLVDISPVLVAAIACTLHCLLYTLAIWVFSYKWISIWGLLACFLAHWPIDRFRLAKWWMGKMGQTKFATGPLSPWSVIVVDNTFHLLTLYVIWLCH